MAYVCHLVLPCGALSCSRVTTSSFQLPPCPGKRRDRAELLNRRCSSTAAADPSYGSARGCQSDCIRRAVTVAPMSASVQASRRRRRARARGRRCWLVCLAKTGMAERLEELGECVEELKTGGEPARRCSGGSCRPESPCSTSARLASSGINVFRHD